MSRTAEIGSFAFSEEQMMLIDSAERFVREDRAAHPLGIEPGGRHFCRERWRAFAELGWLGIAVPEANGGLGGSVQDVAALMEGLGPGLLPDPLIASAIFATGILEQAPESASRKELLSRLATGDAVVAVTHDEIGVDAANSLRASKAAEDFRLSGSGVLSLAGSDADAILVLAHMEDGEPALFVVPQGSFTVLDSYSLLDGSTAGDIGFDDIRVNGSALLASGSAAKAAFDAGLDRAIVAHAAMIVGIARDALNMTSEYLKTRTQFGGPIARFQVLQHRVAEMFVHYQDAVSALHFAIRACEQANIVERAMMVSAAKVVIGDAAKYIGSQSIQLHGAVGVTEDYRIGHYYRKILVFQGMFGNDGFHLARYDHLKEACMDHEQ